MQFNQFNQISKTLNSDFQSIQSHMLQTYGDPLHDVGDASNILELLNNLISPNHDPEQWVPQLLDYFNQSDLDIIPQDFIEYIKYFLTIPAELYNQSLNQLIN